MYLISHALIFVGISLRSFSCEEMLDFSRDILSEEEDMHKIMLMIIIISPPK